VGPICQHPFLSSFFSPSTHVGRGLVVREAAGRACVCSSSPTSYEGGGWRAPPRSSSLGCYVREARQQMIQIDGDRRAMASLAMAASTTTLSRRMGLRRRSSVGAPLSLSLFPHLLQPYDLPGKLLRPVDLDGCRHYLRQSRWVDLAEGAMWTLRTLLRWIWTLERPSKKSSETIFGVFGGRTRWRE
jgi:hypothetical protein